MEIDLCYPIYIYGDRFMLPYTPTYLSIFHIPNHICFMLFSYVGTGNPGQDSKLESMAKFLVISFRNMVICWCSVDLEPISTRSLWKHLQNQCDVAASGSRAIQDFAKLMLARGCGFR